MVLYFICGTIEINSKLWVAVLLFRPHIVPQSLRIQYQAWPKIIFWLKNERNWFMVASIYELNALGIVLSSKIGEIPLTGAIIVQQFSTTNSTGQLNLDGGTFITVP